MDYVLIAAVAFFASLLTFYSGFGLGTLLTPVFAVFFPIDQAVALTGVVHLLNNLFKMGLIGRNLSRNVLFRFGLPAIPAAFLGAWLMIRLGQGNVLFSWHWAAHRFDVSLLQLVIGSLVSFFALYELMPALKGQQFSDRWLSLGGLLSGFFGGLSGHQGALRSAFLIRLNLSKQAYIATGIAIACLVDLSRLAVYFDKYYHAGFQEKGTYLLVACLSAFGGAMLGKQLLRKMSLHMLHQVVGYLLLLMGLAIAAGILS
jgi:uncharacterized membrane protein YfcA